MPGGIAGGGAGADYEAVRIDFGSDEQKKPDFLAINPKGRVPALVSDKGILTETPAILIFISQTYPASSLAPVNDPWALAQAQAFNSYLCATVHVAHAHGGRGHRWADKETSFEDMRQKVQHSARCISARAQCTRIQHSVHSASRAY